jgi:hypothetical protein
MPVFTHELDNGKDEITGFVEVTENFVAGTMVGPVEAGSSFFANHKPSTGVVSLREIRRVMTASVTYPLDRQSKRLSFHNRLWMAIVV